jgi:hypothetical protein
MKKCETYYGFGKDKMAIKPKCDSCELELVEFGAILLSPPNSNNQVTKYHLCLDCYEKSLKILNIT